MLLGLAPPLRDTRRFGRLAKRIRVGYGHVLVAGVDGYKAGWAVVMLRDGEFATAALCPTFADVLDAAKEARAIGVDMPIGLVSRGWRRCDQQARKLLGPRASSVFLTPPRPALEAPSYEAACEVAREVCGKALSKQAHALRSKIQELDGHKANARVFEVHPEISFRILLGYPAPPKRSWAGAELRRAALANAGIVLPATHGADRAPVDDVLDAAIAAWSACRIAGGNAISIPSPATQHDGGRAIAIWA